MKDLVNKGEFFEKLPEVEQKAGYIKFNIPDEDKINSLNGEGVWGWCSEEDKEKYNDDNYHGNIVAILLNTPINYFGRLVWGTEVVLKCHGDSRPTLDPDWVKEYLVA